MGFTVLKLTMQLVSALTNLRGNRDFVALLDGLKEHEAEEQKRCVELEGVALHRAQGAVKTLQWWQDAYLQAPTVFEKLKHSPPK